MCARDELRGLPYPECARFAAAAAVLNTTGPGAVNPIPSRQQVEDRLAELDRAVD